MVRLSEGLKQGGALRPTAIARSLLALEKIVLQYKTNGKPMGVVGTAALRMASNPEVFTRPAEEILGVPVDIISGELEASLTSQGSLLGLDQPGPVVTVDIGGQSTEICSIRRDEGRIPISLDMGVVGLTAKYFRSDPPLPVEVAALRKAVGSVLARFIPKQVTGRLVAVAGTATTLGRLECRLDTWDRKQVHGLEMQREQLLEWTNTMLALPCSDRISIHHIHPARADVFPAGLLMLSEMLDHLGHNSFIISANGLRVGVALKMLEEAP